jgi:hypothetical protein
MLFRVACFAMCGLLPKFAMAFDNSLYSMNAPSTLEAESLVLSLSHGFRTKVVEDNRVGTDLQKKSYGFKSANVSISAKYIPITGVTLFGVSNSSGPEYGVGAGYGISFGFVNTELSISFRRQFEDTEFKNASFSLLSLDTTALQKWLVTPLVTIGYDSYHNHFATGLGASLKLGDWNSVFVEAFPRITKDPRNSSIGKQAAFDAGWRWAKGGHQFFLLVSNSSAAEPRQSMLGSNSRDLNFAFRVTRFME